MDHWFSKNLLSKSLVVIMLAAVVVASIIVGYGWKCLAHDKLVVPATGYEFYIEPGASLRQISNGLYAADLFKHPSLLRWYVILTNNANNLKAGEYRINPGSTALQFLDMVLAGLVTQYSFTIVEGLQTAQIINMLQQHPKIKSVIKDMSEAEIIKSLNISANNLEGIFLPDTYFFDAYTTDVDFLRRAYFSMEQKLHLAWAQRDPHCVLNSPYEALILASIIEKESGLKSEYAEISGVYQRRIVLGMRLQADPTIIYALQDKLQGPLMKKHLSLDSPYNTYKLKGLPPTPIAIPGMAALEAALHPKQGETLYFVATKIGCHIFSKTLQEHNLAVKDARR